VADLGDDLLEFLKDCVASKRVGAFGIGGMLRKRSICIGSGGRSVMSCSSHGSNTDVEVVLPTGRRTLNAAFDDTFMAKADLERPLATAGTRRSVLNSGPSTVFLQKIAQIPLGGSISVRRRDIEMTNAGVAGSVKVPGCVAHRPYRAGP
jgi:hypothetical protein